MIHHYLIHECGLNPAEVALRLKDWEIVPIMDGDEKVGEAMLKGSEIHMAFGLAYRGKCRFNKREWFRAFVRNLLAERKFLVTRSFCGDSTESFIRRLGFVKIRTDGQFNYWWLDKAPWSDK